MLLEGNEQIMGDDDLIVSKTDLKGKLTYANSAFLDIAGYQLKDVLGEPHSMIRNDAMPRCIFKLLWEKISSGNEIFAYVVNATKFDDYYWVLAHVTASRDASGAIVGYHSNRRKPSPTAVSEIKKLYGALVEEENKHKNGKESVAASYKLLMDILAQKGVDYDEYVLSL